MTPLSYLSFEDWVAHTFDHEVSGQLWYFEASAEYWQGPPALTVAYLTRLFEAPLSFLGSYSDEQLNQGFWYLASNGASDYMFALLEEEVLLEQRVRCIDGFAVLFEKLFAVKCSPHLSHLDEPGRNPLNASCYMWWDLLPFCGQPGVAARKEIDEACLRAMEATLSLESIACWESALHGLGHWRHFYPQRVADVVDAFLSTHSEVRADLLRYAHSARHGCVQ
ncbi:MAG: hypothetical protein AB1898_13305 [Acidobacteriota bacterium]